MTVPTSNRDVSVPPQWDRQGLPPWCYHSEALLKLEQSKVFLTHWQIVCHVSDIPNQGDYVCLDLCGERAMVIRSDDDEVRGFHNICRHRGSRVVADELGHCEHAIVCPFHGWVYNLDGTLRGPSKPTTFPALDPHEFGLKPVETEVWQGLVFVRFEAGPQPSVETLMSPFSEQIAQFQFDQMVSAGPFWTDQHAVNWKSVRDVDNEGYHVAVAHPALQELYGRSYVDEPYVDGTSASYATLNSRGRRWSVKNYLNLYRPRQGVDESISRSWLYYGLFPNVVIAVTAESMQFYQEFPTGVGATLQRGAVYRYADETRQQRLARYLAYRIDRETQSEDVRLMTWSDESMASRASSGFYLSDLEYGVKTHHDHLRSLLPVMTVRDAPDERDLARVNTEMSTAG